jgi:predicted DCC family thiol-disulfide oxidoreductase YuxK
MHPVRVIQTGPKRISVRMNNMDETSPPPPNCPIVYFDGSCPLCSIEIAHYQACQGAQDIAFVDVADANVALTADLDRAQAMARFHVRLPDGSLRSGAAAFVALWQVLPRWRWVAGWAGHRRILPILERLYVLFLPWRSRIARLMFKQAKSARQS